MKLCLQLRHDVLHFRSDLIFEILLVLSKLSNTCEVAKIKQTPVGLMKNQRFQEVFVFQIAAFLTEPILSSAGVLPFPKNSLKRCYRFGFARKKTNFSVGMISNMLISLNIQVIYFAVIWFSKWKFQLWCYADNISLGLTRLVFILRIHVCRRFHFKHVTRCYERDWWKLISTTQSKVARVVNNCCAYEVLMGHDSVRKELCNYHRRYKRCNNNNISHFRNAFIQ